ncbi:putative proton/sodium-glutamate symporter [Selenomonas ruminantium subsp. lactilytica TAM6421]|uniref:Putative proton/sodium-glutamate symporter n=1 Tax=Selenomonas ruminantium subsp. lactilytica (strain NBRC 103574 / TAM6421) TaxID=927704 RepID=I0GNH9_SELRL|nr:dicarboxylate/amino acid:cation symporter [Selenomonas ruminantium]BAL82316.1 putative proton/sodium-glutamate symporter [Selenomonas ruminantium subsp. lactilytica TAM6421]
MNLSIKIFIALVLSVVVGLIAGEPALPFINWWIAPIGTMFINLIKMMIVPVVFFSLVVGMTSLGDTKKLGRIGAKTVVLYLLTTAVAILIGFGVAGILSPGTGISLASDATYKVKEAPGLMQVLVAMIPANPIDAMAKAQILPVIVFSLFVGIGIVHVGGERAQLLMKFFDAAAEVSYKIIGIVMQFAPIGVFALLLPVVAKNGPSVLLPLMSVIACVAIGCVIHAVVVYSSLARLWGGHTPMEFFRGMSEAMMIAFTTCSSAAALPVNMKNCQEKLGVSREVSSFVLPLGATINMDGTALYMGVYSLFIANVFGVDLTMGQILMIVLTGTLASIGTAGVPGAGLIMLAMVLQTAGLPLEGLALVAGIDRVLDMFRTCLNITGDAAVTIVMDQEEKKYDSNIAGAKV